MSLDAELQPILDAWAAEDGPPAHEVPVEQARAAHLAETDEKIESLQSFRADLQQNIDRIQQYIDPKRAE